MNRPQPDSAPGAGLMLPAILTGWLGWPSSRSRTITFRRRPDHPAQIRMRSSARNSAWRMLFDTSSVTRSCASSRTRGGNPKASKDRRTSASALRSGGTLSSNRQVVPAAEAAPCWPISDHHPSLPLLYPSARNRTAFRPRGGLTGSFGGMRRKESRKVREGAERHDPTDPRGGRHRSRRPRDLHEPRVRRQRPAPGGARGRDARGGTRHRGLTDPRVSHGISEGASLGRRSRAEDREPKIESRRSREGD